MKKVAGLSTSSPRLARVLALALMGVTVVACGGDGSGDDGDDDDGPPPYTGPVLKRASKSSTIAITGDDKFVVMVNPEDDSISIFDTATDKRTAVVTVGDEPSSVVIGPDDDTAYVANRGDATVVKVTGIKGATPTVAVPLDVGSEPTGLALAPTGRVLFVAEFAEGRIGVIDTATMTLKDKIEAPKNPKAIAVTNDGDQEDADETLVVPEFFGEANGSPEGTDTGRTGKVRLYDVEGLEAQAPITLAPRLTGFKAEAPLGTPVGDEVSASPNQLSSVIVIGSKIYVTSVSASPQGPTFFKTNVQPVVYVGDLGSHKEDTSPLGTMNLAKLIDDQIPADQTRFFMADLSDITFVKTDVMYALSKGGDAIQRIVLDPAKGPTLGSDLNKQIDLGVAAAGGTKKQCQTPTGMVIAHASARAFVNCWVTRQIGFVDLAKQVLAKTEESASIKTGEQAVQDGRRFYFTARGRWSQAAWSSCGSCHPDGLSDNITWHFGTGPRQTTSMDGSYSHAANAPQQQRVLNWTGIFDEIHDFERNTRGVSNGKGAITTPGPSGQCGGANLADEVRVALGLDGLRTSASRAPNPGEDPANVPTAPSSVKELQDKTAGVCTKDWDKIDAFVKTIRPARALRFLDPASVARGAAIFAVPGTPGADPNAAGCAGCHSGPGWTLSRAFYKSTTARVDALAAATFTPAAEFNKNAEKAWNFHAFQVEKQPGSALFAGSPEAAVAGIAPNQVSCAIRNVGTFGVLGDDDATLALETRDSGARAQGRLGYNIPALYGLALGAPYLHHGQAASLEELFNNQKFLQHAEAGSAVWLRQGADTLEQRKKDLINFLLSIDATTKTVAIPAGYDACPANDK